MSKALTANIAKVTMDFHFFKDKEFYEVQDILKKQQNQLQSIGKRNRLNAAELPSDDDIFSF